MNRSKVDVQDGSVVRFPWSSNFNSTSNVQALMDVSKEAKAAE